MASKETTPAIISRHYDFLKWLMERIAKFPRNQKYSFGNVLEQKGLLILEQLIYAYYQRDKLETLKKVNIEIEVIRHYLRLSKDMNFITLNQYEFAINALFEIGKQIGGWIKQQEHR